MLIALSGRPGAGKTTLARGLTQRLAAVHLRIDSIEQAMLRAGLTVRIDEGYRIAYAVAADNLRIGLTVIADSVNDVAITREAWRKTAASAAVPIVEVEVICSDRAEHRRRVEERRSDIVGHKLPSWSEVRDAEPEPWDRPPLVIDTAGRSLEACLAELQALLG